MSRPARMAVTCGDPNGVGPEVALAAALAECRDGAAEALLFGPRNVWQAAANILRVPAPPELDALPARGTPLPPGGIATFDPEGDASPAISPGRIDPAAARAAYAAILGAVAAAMNGAVDAMVTAPINKEAFHAAGIREPGHTELLARLTGARRYAMMLFGDKLRVVLATRHVPLAKVASTLRAQDIAESVELLSGALPMMGFPSARIGVCALNPHAGDGGAIGTEEQTLIGPEIERLRAAGHALEGPIPADAIFYRAIRGDFDAVVAMYHDQGLGPLKMVSFDDGVNWTLGLPIIRTSPDHGTAFDIAWTGRASASSTRSAFRWAVRLGTQPNPWRNPQASGSPEI